MAHDAKFNSANVVSKFIDGLRDDIRAVVLIHRHESLDTASSLALLQKELAADLSRKDHRRGESSSSFKLNNRMSYYTGHVSTPAVHTTTRTPTTRREDHSKAPVSYSSPD